MLGYFDICSDNDDSEVMIEDTSDHSLGRYSEEHSVGWVSPVFSGSKPLGKWNLEALCRAKAFWFLGCNIFTFLFGSQFYIAMKNSSHHDVKFSCV